MYADDVTQRVYRGLLERAESVVGSRRVAVLDATFSRPEQRARAAVFAKEHDVPFLILETRCDEAIVMKRLEERARRALDPSDAGPDFYPESLNRFVPVRAEDDGGHIVVDTGAPSWQRTFSSVSEPGAVDLPATAHHDPGLLPRDSAIQSRHLFPLEIDS